MRFVELDDALSAAGTHPGGVGLLFIDLDDFKNVNDALGHRVGDELLIATARRLLALVRPDDLVARSGATSSSCSCAAPTGRGI